MQPDGQPGGQFSASPQPSPPAQSGASTLGCIVYSVIGLILAGGMAAGGYYLLRGAHEEGGGLVPGTLSNEGGPLVCGGVDELSFEGETVTFPTGTAITAGGNCKLTLVNCNVTAPVAVDVGGNAQVIIRGGTVTGATAAISAGGNAHVVVEGASVSGPVTRGGNAQITGVPNPK